MTRWLYYNLLVFGVSATGIYRESPARREPDGRWYLGRQWQQLNILRDKLHAPGRGEPRVPLNPQRDWTEVFWLAGDGRAARDEVLAWDDDAGYADLAAEVVSKLGSNGWELAGIDGWTYGKEMDTELTRCCRYVFKKPQP